MSSIGVEKIKERLSIREVAESYIKLEKAGRNYKARCPFHNEKTPSFFLSPERDTYYCFGCGARGDIFSLVEHFEGVDFRGALTTLAKRAGVELRSDVGGSREKKDTEERIYILLEEATQFFEKNLKENKEAQDYLLHRGLHPKTVEMWRLGYARETWRDLYDYFIAGGYSERDIELAGLIKKTEKGWYDRFRGRIMFPILNSAGRIIAFSGRLFPKEEEESVPKYLNSPETPLFHKSHVLYGIDKAKGVIRKSDFAIIVEGQMDLLMSHQVGFGNTVATSGTSLTTDHLSVLKRFSNNVVLAMDADRAGVISVERGASLALSSGMNVKIASFPPGKDPAEVCRENPELFRKAIRESVHIIDFLINDIQKRGFDERKFRLMVQKEVFPYVTLITNRIDQAHFIQRLAQRLDLPEEAVREEVKRSTHQKHNESEERETVSEESSKVSNRSRLEQVQDRLLGMLLIEEVKEEPLIDTHALRQTLDKFLELPEKGDRRGVPEEILFETERLYEENGLLKEEVRELVLTLETEYLKISYREALRKLKEAERNGDTEHVALLLKECTHLSKVLESLH